MRYSIHVQQSIEFKVNLLCNDISDPSVLQETLTGHTDAVWGLSIHSSKTQLLSNSSDGTVRLWSPGAKCHISNIKSFLPVEAEISVTKV
jgi:WD40 repeat protein